MKILEMSNFLINDTVTFFIYTSKILNNNIRIFFILYMLPGPIHFIRYKRLRLMAGLWYGQLCVVTSHQACGE